MSCMAVAPADFVFDRSKLPTAPKSTLAPDFDLELVPKKPPFTAFVSNVSFEADESKIRSFFERECSVLGVRFPLDDRGRFRGHCFIDFGNRESLISALQKNDQMFFNKPIRVMLESKGKQQQSGTGYPFSFVRRRSTFGMFKPGNEIVTEAVTSPIGAAVRPRKTRVRSSHSRSTTRRVRTATAAAAIRTVTATTVGRAEAATSDATTTTRPARSTRARHGTTATAASTEIRTDRIGRHEGRTGKSTSSGRTHTRPKAKVPPKVCRRPKLRTERRRRPSPLSRRHLLPPLDPSSPWRRAPCRSQRRRTPSKSPPRPYSVRRGPSTRPHASARSRRSCNARQPPLLLTTFPPRSSSPSRRLSSSCPKYDLTVHPSTRSGPFSPLTPAAG